MAGSEEQSITVGARCVCEGYYGTVCFIGEVPPTKGVWLGVDWDDPSRGKHSGEHEGVLYFKTRTSGSGSFVRPKKVFLGCTFIKAIQKKYGDPGSDNEEDMVVGGQSVEMVGIAKIVKKQSEHDKLIDASLREMNISSVGSPGEIATTTPNIQLLNLARNPLLSNWKTVADITLQLNGLESLDLSEDVGLSCVPENIVSLSPAFNSLRTLYINRISISWHKVSLLLKAMPRLEELHVCENIIESLRFDGDDGGDVYMPRNLQLLNLEKNKLSDWSDILRLEPQLKQLKTLILNDNFLPSVFFKQKCEDSPPQNGFFPVLRSLSLSRNLISEWSSVTCISSLTSLVELKFKDNPLLKDEPGFTARQLVIARLAQISCLGRSDITLRERQLAERYYLKKYGRDWMSLKSDETKKEEFLKEHPRFSQLVGVHGLPDEVLISQAPATAALKHGLISVTVRCPDHPELKALTKKLPGSMTVQKLKGLLQRIYKVDLSNQRLSYVDKRGDLEIELDDDIKQLTFFSVENGDTILLRW